MQARGYGRVGAIALLALAACAVSAACAQEDSDASSPAGESDSLVSARISRPAPERLVAIGDLHGDLEITRKALRLAGAIDDRDAWIGAKLVVVQTGDEIDRDDDDRAILDLVERLKVDAKRAGGEFIALVGNHELDEHRARFRYVTANSFASFADVQPAGWMVPVLADVKSKARGRGAAFFRVGLTPRCWRSGRSS